MTADLSSRLACCRPEDTVRGFVFSGVLRVAVRELGEPRADALRLRHLGPKRQVDFFAYPCTAFLSLMYAVAEEAAPKLGSAEAVFDACGAEASAHFLTSAAGAVMVRLVGGAGARRTLGNVPGAYAACVSYGKRKVIDAGPNAARILFEQDMQPVAFHEGVLREGLKRLGAPVEVKGHARATDSAEYHLTWK